MVNDPTGDWQERLARKARLRASAGLRRELRPRGTRDGMVDLAGNDYLGLSRHPAVLAAATTALAQYGLTPDDISERVAMQVDMMHFIDLRFRPNIHIDPRSVEEYYVAQLLPELRRSGAAEITLKEASPKIEEVLVQQRMGEMLTAWLRNLRQQIPVVVR